MKTLPKCVLFSSLLACEPKSMDGTSGTEAGSTSSTDPTGTALNGEWAIGSYYRPGDTTPSGTLAKIDVQAGGTAVLWAEHCDSEKMSMFMVGWAPLNDDSIEFVSLDPMKSSLWYGAPFVGDKMTLSRTADDKVVRVTDGKTVDNAYMGDFRVTTEPVCLVHVDLDQDCDNGAYVMGCPAP